jgi:putative ABC transport system permease protein
MEQQAHAAIEISAVSEEKPFGYKNYDGTLLIISSKLFDSMAQSNWIRAYYSCDDADKLQEELDEFLKGMDYSLNNNEADYRRTNNLFTLIGIFLYGFIIVISLIGITNIFNTITTNMELRKPEFAMLRSIGMTNHEFHRMIRLESLFMGIRSLLFGIPAGVALSYLIYRFLSAESGVPYRLPVSSILIAAAVVFVLIFLIMTYSMGKTRKQNIIETIRNENI